MTENSVTHKNTKQKKWPLYLSIVIIACLVACYFLIPSFKDFLKEAYRVLTSDDDQRISNWVAELGVWGPLFIAAAMILQMFLIFIPSWLLMIVSVLAYGPYWGVVISVGAVYLASTVGYWIGRSLGVVTVYKLLGSKKENKIEYYVERYGYWAVVITRLAPVLSNDAISFIGGLMKMNYWKFIGATLLGIMPLAVLFAWFGENNDRLQSGLLWTSGVCLVLFIGYIIYDRRKK